MFGKTSLFGHSYKGFIYKGEWHREDEEVSKLYHTVINPDGTECDMDWSSYTVPTIQEFELWIDLGLPGRITNGPLSMIDLEKLISR